MKHIALLLVLAACTKTNDVTLLLGPDEDRLSRGFACRAVAAPNDFLMASALVPGTRTIELALVVDVLELDASGVFPGCRGEELLSLCRNRDCKKSVRRQCVEGVRVEFPPGFDPNNAAHVKGLVDTFHTALGSKPLLKDLPDSPVIIRVVAMKTCPANWEAAQPLEADDALGCAYSCPVQLDQVSGSVAISLDTFDDNCEPAVRSCAAFPNL